MYIMGLGGSLHDFSACLMKDTEIVVAIEEERLTRIKHSVDRKKLEEYICNKQLWKMPRMIPSDTLDRSISYCLADVGIYLNQIDFFVTTDSIAHLPTVKSLHNLLVINHHLAHASSAFYPSPYEDAAILVVDGRGSHVHDSGKSGYETVTFGYGNGNRIELLGKVLNHSLGHFYEAVTIGIGFGALEEGKTMGLAPYGRPTYKKDFMELYELGSDGQFVITKDPHEIMTVVKEIVNEAKNHELFQVKADLAYAAQTVLQNIMLHLVDYVLRETKCDNLCIAGGVGLNGVANGLIYKSFPLKGMFIQPAAGDNGLAIGSAMYGAFFLRNLSRRSWIDIKQFRESVFG